MFNFNLLDCIYFNYNNIDKEYSILQYYDNKLALSTQIDM